ncbi:MAG: polyphosphate kinase 1 [Methanoregulaceae archaeon]|nr:polyphosphate kinase 1 [Methanoregulaceae archaeon]
MDDSKRQVPRIPGVDRSALRTLYINREESWIRFNGLVLDEAMDPRHPLLERVKFLAISAGNLDEFFMIRVSGLVRQLARGVLSPPPDGATPAEQLSRITRMLGPFAARQSVCWRDQLVPGLQDVGITIASSFRDLSDDEKVLLRDYFEGFLFPVLTPLAFDRGHPFPFISNLSLSLAVTVRDPGTGTSHFARVKVPTRLFPRLVRVPDPGSVGDGPAGTYIFLEDLVAAHLDLLFPGMEVECAHPFRVIRDADLEIEEDEASDLLTAVEESVELRRIGSPVACEVTEDMPDSTRLLLSKKLGMPPEMFFTTKGPVGMADLAVIAALDLPAAKDRPFVPSVPPGLEEGKDIFAAIRTGDILLYHPYDSFAPVTGFLLQAARDPDVLAIKCVLYRVGRDSPVVAALLEAREKGKMVAAMIELKARFDEENNIGWARALERAGVHVVYGIAGLKVHAKLCLVVRREGRGISRYTHLSTGNYNAGTSRAYTDFGLFTSDPEIGADAADLFNYLTGYARISGYRKLLVSPVTAREGILSRIEREIERHRAEGGGRILFKMNALVDPDCILALYRASQAGVRVDLLVRGICCLRPGVPGVSETISVTTVVGRFLEHSRVYYFRNGGADEVFLGSADLMPRNLDRRVEVLFPVEDPGIKSALLDTILPVQQDDSSHARRLGPDGNYERVLPAPGEPELSAQEWFIAHRGAWHGGGGEREHYTPL